MAADFKVFGIERITTVAAANSLRSVYVCLGAFIFAWGKLSRLYQDEPPLYYEWKTGQFNVIPGRGVGFEIRLYRIKVGIAWRNWGR